MLKTARMLALLLALLLIAVPLGCNDDDDDDDDNGNGNGNGTGLSLDAGFFLYTPGDSTVLSEIHLYHEDGTLEKFSAGVAETWTFVPGTPDGLLIEGDLFESTGIDGNGGADDNGVIDVGEHFELIDVNDSTVLIFESLNRLVVQHYENGTLEDEEIYFVVIDANEDGEVHELSDSIEYNLFEGRIAEDVAPNVTSTESYEIDQNGADWELTFEGATYQTDYDGSSAPSLEEGSPWRSELVGAPPGFRRMSEFNFDGNFLWRQVVLERESDDHRFSEANPFLDGYTVNSATEIQLSGAHFVFGFEEDGADAYDRFNDLEAIQPEFNGTATLYFDGFEYTSTNTSLVGSWTGPDTLIFNGDGTFQREDPGGTVIMEGYWREDSERSDWYFVSFEWTRFEIEPR